MRIVSLAFSFLVTLSLLALVLAYLPHYVGRQRVYFQGPSATSLSDTAPTAADSNPYQQRYYSQSQGWTYYTLPSYSTIGR